MSISNPAGWFAICALCLLIGWALLRSSAFYRAQVALPGRFECIDGLRGFLALGVFAVHAVNMYTLLSYGGWSSDIAPFHNKASSAGVALFFMITGFLFWLRVLRAGSAFDTRAFFASRLWRLTPMYLMSVLMVVTVVAAATGFGLHGSPAALARELRPWLSFGFMDTGAVNGLADARYINAVYWTLAYEWLFYLALPLLALFARGWGAAALIFVVLAFGTQKPIVFNFLFGALAAWTVHRRLLEGRLGSRWLGVLPLASLGAYFALPTGNGLAQSAALFGFFIFVVHGWSLFGLLRTRAAKVLGTISYSIYLTHCIALYITMHAVDRLVPVRTLEGGEYWMLAGLAAAGCVLLSALTYRYVEHPFLHSQPARQPKRASAEAVV
ncbi:MAG TPA: acyltransferase [Burkholderiales bacterium]|nr:acyltransferase [Burkholderiales bacterium]